MSLLEWHVDANSVEGKEFGRQAIAAAKRYASIGNDLLPYMENRILDLRKSRIEDKCLEDVAALTLECAIKDVKIIMNAHGGYIVHKDTMERKVGHCDHCPLYWNKYKEDMYPTRGFERLTPREWAQCNPLTRFKYEKTENLSECIATQWQSYDATKGIVLEGVVAWHIEKRHSISCLSCGEGGQLRWNGGGSIASAWADILCLNCKSAYEVKSKRTKDDISKCFSYCEVGGGSFATYHKNRSIGQHFVVFVDRLPTSREVEDTPYHSVTAVEIDHVLPKLTPKSFNTERAPDLFLGSRIILKENSRTEWFQFDPPGGAIPNDIAKHTFDSYFGSGNWTDHVRDSDAVKAAAKRQNAEMERMFSKVSLRPETSSRDRGSIVINARTDMPSRLPRQQQDDLLDMDDF